ncbi:MAG: PhnD/SsuA/transferrin family substrate-binding protein [bacterium]
MKRYLISLLVILGTLLWTPRANAGSRNLLICIPGSPGTSATAQTYMAPFYRRIESLATWQVGSLQGSYQPTYSGCLSKINSWQPGFAVMSQGVYLEHRKALRLNVIGSLQMFAGAGKQLYLVVKKGSFKTVADLQGKRLTSNHLEETKFLNKVMFGGKIDVTRHFLLKQVSQTTKGMRDVVRGRADATIINDDELRTMNGRSWRNTLQIIHKSPRLPGAVLVAFGKWASRVDLAQMKKVARTMCAGPGGRKLCRASGIQSAGAATQATYGRIIRLFGK